MHNLADREKEILAFWESERIFEKSLAKNKGKKTFVFYEGPPTANGKPGIHHVLARAYKDIILRFKTMQGFYVPRKAGWDTHGLPVELEVEKALGINSRKEIEKYGIEKFVTKARESVWKYKKEWEELTRRMGFWLDMDDPYITYEKNYIESLWFIIKEFWKKKLLEEDFKVVPWCYRCGTPLSSHELAQGYKTITDKSVIVKFPISNFQFPIKSQTPNPKAYILSWTTTPWTLPGNVALAVGKDIDYVLARVLGEAEFTESGSATIKEEFVICAEKTLGVIGQDGEYHIWNHHLKVIDRFKGKDLVGLSYRPLFDVPQLKNEKSHKVYVADFVNTDEGTGVVHTSVMYGEDDYRLGKKVGLPTFHTVTEEGKFIDSLGEGLGGLSVKAEETEDKIISYLKRENLFFAEEDYLHDYPFCWRCANPLLYYATKSWFIRVSKVREKLLENNEGINWVPEHLKHGRFGNFLEEAKDWSFSRSRYWGTPLPIWKCKECNHTQVIGSLEELLKKAKPRNTFYLLRHCGAQNNEKGVVSSSPEMEAYHLTEEGKCQAQVLAGLLKKEKIDMIISSPILRAKETAKIIAMATGAPVSLEERLREIDVGPFNGKKHSEYHAFWETSQERFTKGVSEGMENFHDLNVRLVQWIKEIDATCEGKRIAVVTHGGGLWVLEGTLKGFSEKEIASLFPDDFRTGEMRKTFVSLPLNNEGEIDLHRPYIDGIELSCAKCKGIMKRIQDVADVWFDSGAMPFAQTHWPFAQNYADSNAEERGKSLRRSASSLRVSALLYPADYICEAVDQTRGWFYTLLAVSTLLDKGTPYKNVISLGHVLDEKGQKMSKSKGNVVDPVKAAEEFGMDAIRWYFFVVNPPGFPKRFDSKEIRSHHQRFLLTLFNVLNFWKLYGQTSATNYKLQTTNLLDKWILSRLQETIDSVNGNLNSYDVPSAARELEMFVDDLSNWYLRRSRARFQGKERKSVSRVLHHVLFTVAGLCAPFTPFSAELLYRELGGGKEKSIHLTSFPKSQKRLINQKVIEEMALLREVIAKALAKRAEAGIKVRQPIASLKIKNKKSKIKNGLVELIKEEVNVKEIIVDETISEEIELDTTLTEELLEEGFVRELIRCAQELRKQAGLLPAQRVILYVEADPGVIEIVQKFSRELIHKTGAERLEVGSGKSEAASMRELNFRDKRIRIGINA